MSPHRATGSQSTQPAPRAVAVRVLMEVVDKGNSLTATLEDIFARTPLAGANRALVQELSYGVLRWYWPLEVEATRLLTTAMRKKDRDIWWLIMVGLYELQHLRRPNHAVVSETVNACSALHKPWTKGLVNAVLRTALRATVQPARPDQDLQAQTSHPLWLVKRIQRAWPSAWEDIVAANNDRPPMCLRVNRRMVTRQEYMERLSRAGLASHASLVSDVGITLRQPVPVERLPGFMQGHVSVQDVAAQLVAPLMDLAPELDILDACAAPGGKTAHMLELQPSLKILALDRDPRRARQVRDTLDRLGLSAQCVVGDARVPDRWGKGLTFDRILVDAPCSATGVVRRHPDIKHHRRDSDISGCCTVQAQLLDALWPLVRRNGKLVYTTCSIFPEENEAQIKRFAAHHVDARIEPVAISVGIDCALGRQVLPGTENMDGFYYAIITRVGRQDGPQPPSSGFREVL